MKDSKVNMRGSGSKGTCQPNTNCCPPESECAARKFNPPLLSTPSEFCAQMLAQGLPVPDGVVAKPKKLVIEKESPPLAKLATSRHIKNWQKWCYIWRQTYNAITAKQNLESRPPIMSSGEGHRFKTEDKELFDRTVHAYHLKGFYIKNADFPNSIRSAQCYDNSEITEVITSRYLRDFPEMKRQRFPKHIRNEVSIPPRKAETNGKIASVSDATQKGQSDSKGFNYEEQWASGKYVEKIKGKMACDFGLYGKSDSFGDTLIVQPDLLKENSAPAGAKAKTTKRNSTGASSRNKNEKQDFTVPQLVFTTDDDNDGNSASLTNYDERSRKGDKHYSEFRGPILRIRNQACDTSLTYKKPESDTSHLLPASEEPSESDGQWLYDENNHFSITPKCKDMQVIKMKNEGTTAIRYQWFRNPPNMDEVKMLEDPTYYKSLRLPSEGNNLEQENSFEAPPAIPQLKLQKKTNLEFHFSGLPGMILPGQSIEFPIIYRSKNPGYFQETMYLATHPRIRTDDGKNYAVRMSGVCTHTQIAEKGNECYEAEALKRYLDDKSLEEESRDLIDSMLDRSLWEIAHCGTLVISPPTVESQSKGTITPVVESECGLTSEAAERRKYTACYANVVATFEGILHGFDSFDSLSEAAIQWG